MNDDELRRLLSDAVSDVEPEDRLDQIRAAVNSDPKVVPMSRPHPWRYAAVGVAATLAVIGGVAYAAGDLPGSHQADNTTPVHPGPSSHHPTSPPTTPVSAPTTSTSAPVTGLAGTKAYAVYYVGTNPAGKPVLFREFHRGPDVQAADPGGNGNDVLTEAVRDALATNPLDPDYTSPWPGLATLDYASYESTGAGYTLQVALTGKGLANRPAGMSAAEARAAVQQLVYTSQAAIGKRVPVHFSIGRRPPGPHPTLLGVDISHDVANAPVLKTLSLVNISSPNQGDPVSGKLVVTGVNNAFEGSSVIYLERNGKKYLVSPTIGGMGGNKMWPWTVTLDLSKVAPGTYTLVAQNDDPSGQGHPEIDTRTIAVK
jgi:hypothetical protein